MSSYEYKRIYHPKLGRFVYEHKGSGIIVDNIFKPVGRVLSKVPEMVLRRFPLNVRAVSAKIKLPKKYLQHCHILRTDKKNLSLLLLPS